MAKVYRAPEGFEPPPFNIDTWQEDEQAYLARLADRCKMNGTNPLHGETIHFPVADGAATYMVWKTSPLELIHVEIGDAWNADPRLLRGLRLADIREDVERAKRIAALFAEKRDA